MATSRNRRRRLAREKWERQEARRLEHERAVKARRRLALGSLACVVAGVLLGFGLRQLVAVDQADAAAAPVVPQAAPARAGATT